LYTITRVAREGDAARTLEQERLRDNRQFTSRTRVPTTIISGGALRRLTHDARDDTMAQDDKKTPTSDRAKIEREAQRLKQRGWDPRASAAAREREAEQEAQARRPNAAEVAAEVRRLKQKQGWDPARFVTETPQERLQQLDQELKDVQVYAEASGCAACDAARASSADPTALCAKHLADAMGF
jgi:hypothetical protein